MNRGVRLSLETCWSQTNIDGEKLKEQIEQTIIIYVYLTMSTMRMNEENSNVNGIAHEEMMQATLIELWKESFERNPSPHIPTSMQMCFVVRKRRTGWRVESHLLIPHDAELAVR